MSEIQRENSIISHSFVRILHNIGNSGNLVPPEVDIYLDSKVIAYNLSYGDFTAYISVLTGDHVLTAKRSNSDIIVAQEKVRLYDGVYYTTVIAGQLNNSQSMEVIVNQDNLRCPRAGYASFRFIHGAAGYDNVDVYSGENLIFSNVDYGQSTSYRELKLGYAQIAIVRHGQSPDFKTEICNPYLVSGGVYSVILSLNALPGGLVVNGIVANDTRGACEQLQSDFDVSEFMGKWYVIASIPQAYETNCARATAEYTQLQNYIRIVNTCYNEDWVPGVSASGTGYQQPCDSGSLRVSFHSSGSGYGQVTTPGPNYLVHRTNYDGFAVIGTPNRRGLWILSRRSKMSFEQYQRLVKYTRRLGYDINQIQIKYHALTRSERSN